jgi:hypothetical protein
MAWINQLIKGAKVAGRALKKAKLKSSKTGAIRSVKPGVGGLKASREVFEDMQKSSAIGVKKFGRPHTTKVISEQGVEKGFPGLTKAGGDLERSRKKLEKITGKKIDKLKLPKGKD